MNHFWIMLAVTTVAGFAAGAMLVVVLGEMVPSSHGHGYADAARAAFLVGFILLVVIDAVIAV